MSKVKSSRFAKASRDKQNHNLKLKTVYLGADHRGFELKGKVKGFLEVWGCDVMDLGAAEYTKSDDYTVYAGRVASMVAENEKSFGVLMCGSGVGMDVVANKFDGIRASFGKNDEQVRVGRRDDNMNILVLAADYTSEKDAEGMLKAFLETKYEREARHEKRLEDIKKIEANN